MVNPIFGLCCFDRGDRCLVSSSLARLPDSIQSGARNSPTGPTICLNSHSADGNFASAGTSDHLCFAHLRLVGCLRGQCFGGLGRFWPDLPDLAPAWQPREPFCPPAGRGGAAWSGPGATAARRPATRPAQGGNGGRVAALGACGPTRGVADRANTGATAANTRLLGQGG